ncbi:BirA family biotin operon repressor/biotin-[acetyl-CoA-carboxylase] ligase [Roseimicrobium gellanilyticum]|uniref:biotin--[biotin carboxyl-carrier protein] ligase n=1 Tax=Roseimicrobium gellanilyticum TaxID=748857 RepID=A0A366H2J7_9BACT|nr:biotin--[acetyl-CoA-carboxylase] ligase [Roseimicrobium gellanilyticum]RBP36131.1 BirA family biotin operon repressor/biotin-[acetyl-CoA-carboxylase] ligase [Roseimicrobium gellanilyticum]
MSLQTTFTPLEGRRLSAALAGHIVGGEVQTHEEIASTSDLARELGAAGYAHGLVIFAETQTAGRGRRENRWSAPAGQDILCSILLRPSVRMEHWARLTTMAALAICRSIETTTSLHPEIKWPNDVFVQDKKCAGILAETFTGETGAYMVLGIGLNVNTDAYPPELRDIATSMRLAMGDGRLLDRNVVAIALMKQIDRLLPLWEQGYGSVIDEVRRRSRLLGHVVKARVDGREVEGMATDLTEEGHLMLTLANGSALTLTSAEQVRMT